MNLPPASRTTLLRIAAFLVFLFPAHGANLSSETVKAWEDYIQTVNTVPVNARKAFLWMDGSPDRIAKVRAGETVVSAAAANNPKEVPSGLIHDWIGAVFIAGATIDQVLPVVRDYGRYKDFYRPSVIISEPVALGDTEDRFTVLLVNKSLFRKSALDTDYLASQFRVDDQRRYTITRTTRIQEIAEYGGTTQHALPEDQGTGLIWRLFGVTRFEERDGGVYVEVEAIALSRDIPASLRWLVEPIVRRTARAALRNSLQQTREAVHSSCALANRTVAVRR